MDHDSASLRIPVAIGELFDRFTILAIKEFRISDPVKLHHIRAEKADLASAFDTALAMVPEDSHRRLAPMVLELLTINASLWEVEESLRNSERSRLFDARFVVLARCVYLLNDSRAALKRMISLATGSLIIEEKSYS